MLTAQKNASPQNSDRAEVRHPQRKAIGLAILLLTGLLPHQAVNAENGIVMSGSDSFDLTVSGQINRALMIVDDGEETTLLNVDNNNSSSRIRFIAESNNEGPLTVGAAYEAEFTINNSASISQEETDSNDTRAYRARRAEILLEYDSLGKLWLGQGSTATDGVSQSDLSGTMNAGYSFVSLVGGGILFRDSNTGQLSNTDLGDVSDNLDGFSRNTRLRYDTPEFGDWEFRTSVINDGAVDVGAFYTSEIRDWRVIGAIGYGNASQLDDSPEYDDQVSGSISVRNEQGLNFTLAAGIATATDSARDDLNFIYGKVGYRNSFFPDIGETALSMDWGQTRNEDQDNDTADVIGAQVAQGIDIIGVEIYATVRNASLDRQYEDFDDNLIGMVGARLDF